MDKTKLIKLLHNKKASRDQLREALASLLGVPYQSETKEAKNILFCQCSEIFGKAYKMHTSFDYVFTKTDGIALAQLIDKVCGMTDSKTDADALATFSVLIQNLPEWYKVHAFSLKVINSKFNEIVASIKNDKQKGITGNLRERTLNRFFT